MRSSNYLRRAKRTQNRTSIDTRVHFTSNDQVVGKDTLASIMDVTITSVERWIRDGMPVEQRGTYVQEWVFNLNEVKQWKSNI